MRRPAASLAAVSAFAVWLDFSRLHQGHHADSLIPVLAGLTAWTPFYWGQDRFGLLVPLLALPVRSPGAHLLVQGFLVIALSTWGVCLLVRTLLPDYQRSAPAAALALVLLLLLAPAEQRFNILWVQPYTLSFGLALSGVALLHRAGPVRVGAAAVLCLLGAWVNVSVAVVVAPLVLWRALCVDIERSAMARLRFLGLGLTFLVVATYCSARLSRSLELPHTPTEVVPRTAWAHAAAELLRGAWANPDIRFWMAAAAGLGALGLASLVLPTVRASARPVLIAALGLVLTAALAFAAVSVSKWVAQNGYSLRYLNPSLVLLQAALCLLGTLPLLLVPRDRDGAVSLAMLGAVGLAVLLAVGPPSGHAVVTAFESRWGNSARDVIAARATHVSGDYWKVWPTVFYASWLLDAEGSRQWPFGVTDRSVATLDRALAVPHPRVALLEGNGAWLGLLGPRRWAVVDRRPTCLVVTAR